jgi:hypothetical protein
VDYPGRTAHLGEAPTDNGYDPSGVNDEEGDDFVAAGNNHHEDVEDFDEPHDPDDEYEGVRYLSVDPAVGVTPGWGDSFVRRRLRSYERFGGLPLGGYRPPALADYFDDHTAAGWSAASADHPVWLAAQLTYHGVARWGRHLHRGVTPVGAVLTRRRRRRRRGRSPRPGGLVYSAGWDPLWDELGQTGWYVFELDDTDYRFDDLDVVEYGRPDEARRTVSGGYHAARYRPGAVAAAAGAVWAPPAGWNTWRYVVAEGDDPGRDDPEGYFLECLSRTYLDHYDEHYFVADLEMFIDRDYDDLHEGAPIEEENQEVPRTRPSDYPGWLVAAAVAGASAGDVTQPGRSARLAGDDVDVEAAVVAYRPGRAELRRYYRASRDARGRVARTRPPRLTAPDYGELGELADELGLERDVDPAPAEVDAFGPAEIVGLEGDDWTDESLRLWALTEVYWGDLPQGSANTH